MCARGDVYWAGVDFIVFIKTNTSWCIHSFDGKWLNKWTAGWRESEILNFVSENQVICLPMHHALSEEDVKRVIDCVRNEWVNV